MEFLNYLTGVKNSDGSVSILDPNENNKTIMLFDKYRESKPDYRNKYQMYNCYRYHLKWKA